MTISRLILIPAILALTAAAGFFALRCDADWCLFFDWQKARLVKNFEDCARLGFPVGESYPRQCWAGRKVFKEDIGNWREKSDLVQISNLQPYQTIESPLVIEGRARGYWFFEASFPIRLGDESGLVLGETSAQAQGEWMSEDFVPFKAALYFDPPTGERGMLILEKDNPSGLPEHADEMNFPVAFRRTQSGGETMTIQVFFGNTRLNSGAEDCKMVFPVNREIPKTKAVARSALEALLKGPTGSETKAGYFTAINPGVAVQNLIIERGVAKADFGEELERGVGGSCRIQAIRSQIFNTLKQFPAVAEVVISIDGRIEDILQP